MNADPSPRIAHPKNGRIAQWFHPRTTGFQTTVSTIIKSNILLTAIYSVFIVFLLLVSQAIQAANPIDTLLPGQWYEVPNSKIRNVLPPPAVVDSLRDTDGPGAIVTAWNGGGYDSKRDRYIVWGGGHANYAGNEVYAFDIQTLSWARLNDPSPASALTVDQPYYTDGKPSSRHTYDYTLYVPNIDRFCSIGGAALRGTGNASTQNVDCFNFDTLQWERKADTYYWGIGGRAAYNPKDGHVYALGSGDCPTWLGSCPSQMGDWNPVINVWLAPDTNLYNSDPDLIWNYGLTVAIDSIKQKLYAIGQGLMLSYDLTVPHGTKAVLNPLGAREIIGVYAPGLVYDPVSKKLVAWSGGQYVYTYDPDTNTWTKVSPSASNTVIPTAAAANGTYNRFQYIPSKNAFIIVNSIDENVFIFKLSAAAAKPLVSFTLSSPLSQAAAPFSLGQAFKQGDIPSGMTVLANIPNFQATVKSRWPDGSVQFAILSGRANLQANVPLQVDLSAGTAPNAGANLTEQDLRNFGANAQITFQGTGSVPLPNLIGQAGAYDPTTNQWRAGKVVDWIQGPEMSSWIYSSPIGTDPSLSAWYEVRLWKDGQTEIIPWIENGYLMKPGTTQKSGQADVTINGVSRFSANLNVIHHTRTLLASGNRLSYWLSTDPQVSFKHDTDYLQKTKLVPTYSAKTSSTSPLFTRLPNSFIPFAQAAFPVDIGSPGYHPSIGLLPEWDVAYLSTGGDPQALLAVAIQAYEAGRYGIHYRDEKTNRPPAFSSYPNLVLNDTNYISGIGSTGTSSTNQYTAGVTGAAPPGWATSHAPSVGYMAYLLYGQFYFMEETEFAASTVYLKQTDTVRQFSKGIMETTTGANTTRGAAWALRTVLHAGLATPDGVSLKKEYQNSLDENFNYYYSRYIASSNNPQGVVQPYQEYTPGDNIYMHATWMEDFLTAAFGYIIDTQAITPTLQAKALEFFNWKAQSIIGRLGSGGAGEYDFRDAAQYYIAVAPSDFADWVTGAGPWYLNWGGNYLATMGADAGTALPNQLRGAYFPEATGYWGNLQPAIAYAVILNAPGAQAAYARMAGASNWSQFLAAENDDPVWSVIPSTDQSSPPPTNLPTLTLTATPTVINYQGSSTLNWSSTNVSACTASGGWTGTKSVSGSETLTGLTSSQTYTLTCTGSGGTVNQSVNLTVNPQSPLPTLTLTATPTVINYQGSSTLNWSSTNASACTASGGWTGTKPVSGSETLTGLTSSLVYTLSCTGSGGTVNQSVNVTVNPQSPGDTTVTLGASMDTSIEIGQKNAGADTTLYVYRSDIPYDRSLIKFDLSSIPTGSTITSAKLRLYGSATGAIATEIHRVTHSWVEGTGDYSFNATNGASWTSYNGTNSWATTGGDFASTVEASLSYSTTGWHEWNIGNMTQSWVNGTYANEGMILLSTTDYVVSSLVSREGANSSQRPQLVVTYSTTTPPPSTNPPTLTLTATPTVINYQGSSTLNWSSTDASACTASGGWTGTKSVSGSETLTGLTSSQTYTLTCTGSGGTVNQSVNVTVNPQVPPPTLTFTATPAVIDYQGSSILNWSSTNASACTASGGWTGTKPVSGSETLTGLTSSQVYTLSCTGNGGTVNQSVNVTVNPQTPIDKTVTLGASMDTSIEIGQKNAGADTTLYVYRSDIPYDRSLIKFDLSSIPTGSTITSAKLRLYGSATGVIKTEIHRVTRSWVEGTGDYSFNATNGASWTSYNGTNSWITKGGDFASTVEASLSYSATGWHVWNIGNMTQAWVNGTYANNGMILLSTTDYVVSSLVSRQGANSSQRPQLVVTYR